MIMTNKIRWRCIQKHKVIWGCCLIAQLDSFLCAETGKSSCKDASAAVYTVISPIHLIVRGFGEGGWRFDEVS